MRVGFNSPIHCINIFCGTVDDGREPLPVGPGTGSHSKPVWQLICDPSGDFVLGRLFNYMDIETALSGESFSEGTRFQNMVTGKIVELRHPVTSRGRNCLAKTLQIRRICK